FAPDFVKLAEAYGCHGIRITEKADVVPAIRKALEIKDRPIILDFHISREENVYPMVPAGKTIKDTIMRELA
ncbi:MAG TPA: thiamine pyrophosphate-dependent enzyme, partial [Spirochaetota bacterium]|nr:thiamine pyrophosphate-dependent enzyme [Spirochaetota bacterium]